MTKPLEYAYTFSGADEFQVPVVGRFMLINDASGDVWVSLNHGSELKRGKKSNIAAGEQIKNVKIRSAIAQTVRFTISDEKQEEGRDDVNVNASATIAAGNNIATSADVSIAATSSSVIAAANSNRLGVTIKNLTGNTTTVRIGESGGVGVTRGHPLDPGESITLSTTSAVYGYNTHLSAQSVSVLEVESI